MTDLPQIKEKTGEIVLKDVRNIQELKPLESEGSKELAFIKKKRQYLAFKRLVAKGGYTSARIVANALGVDDDTIYKWLETKAIKDAMFSSTDVLVNELQSMKNPQGHMYLLNRISPIKESKSAGNTTILGLSITLQK